MTVKKLNSILFAVMLVCIVGTAVFLILAPDRLPAHYNFAGEVDRFGSKYEYLLFPLFAVGMGVLFRAMAGQQVKKGLKTNAKALLYTSICTAIFFAALGGYFMVKALRYDPEAVPKVSYDQVNRFINIGIGALLVALGNIMPKMRRNGLFGLRTKWSMANDTVWQKSQRFGGIASVVAGAVLILLALVVPGNWSILLVTAVIAVWLAVSLVASRRYYMDDIAGRKEIY